MRRATWILVMALGAVGCGKKAESGSAPGEPAGATEPAAGQVGGATGAAAGATTTAGEQAAAGGATAAAAEPAEAQPPRLGFVKGRIQVIDGEGTHEIAEGASVLPGSVLLVDPEAQAELDLPDGSVVDLDEMTELLVREASVAGEVRTIDLAVLAGTIRIEAAKNKAEGSYFRISTPGGTTEVQGTTYVIGIAPDRRATDVVVLGGSVHVVAGDAVRDIEPAGEPLAVRIVPGEGVQPVPPPPVIVESWDDWTDRQADELITRYDIDIQTPEVIAAPVLVVDAQPFWRTQVELRRHRVATRARVLVAVVGAPALVALPTARARFELAREAWVPVVYVPRHERIAVVREVRLAAWAGHAEERAEVRAELVPVLIEARTAWIDHKGKVHGHGHGHGVAVVVPVAPPPPVVVPVVPAPVVVGGGAAVVVRPPSVTVTVPSVSVQVPGVSVGIGAGVRVGVPAPVVVGSPPVVAPAPVVIGVPPAPTVVVPGGRHHGHGRGHDEHGEGEGRGHERHDD
ncbi:MAG: FecR domain-containing protein [Deltaproteobacteria bacterium]|nr:FecR domain-containing protein [Deltaproteobacteria bacterium]